MSGLIAFAFFNLGLLESNRETESRKHLLLTRADSSEYEKFKKEVDLKMKEFDKDIAQLKTKTKKESAELQNQYNKDVIVLEQKKNELKKEIEKEKQADKAKFNDFKHDFKKSMDDLDKSIKDLMGSK